MTLNPPSALLSRFFAGLAEQTFQTHLGVADPPLIDYVGNLLVRFVRYDTLYRVRGLTGRRMQEVGQMLAEAEARIGDARREVHRHIGDFTLFWAGIFPESLQRNRGPAPFDGFIDYCEHGKRAYFIASTIETEHDEDAPGEVLERLSERFELCAYGLREIRREWERREGDDVPRGLLIN
jgi:hypothetical protein